MSVVLCCVVLCCVFLCLLCCVVLCVWVLLVWGLVPTYWHLWRAVPLCPMLVSLKGVLGVDDSCVVLCCLVLSCVVLCCVVLCCVCVLLVWCLVPTYWHLWMAWPQGVGLGS